MLSLLNGRDIGPPPEYTPTPPSSVKELLEQLHLEQYEELFDRELLDLESLLLCDDADLRGLGLPLGARRKIRASLLHVRTSSTSYTAGSSSCLDLLMLGATQHQHQHQHQHEGGSNSNSTSGNSSNSDEHDPPPYSPPRAASQWTHLSLPSSVAPNVPSDILHVPVAESEAAASSLGHGFLPGRVLEVIDPASPGVVVRAAQVVKATIDQVLVHMFTQPAATDFWSDVTSPNLRPIGWAKLHDLPWRGVPQLDRMRPCSWDTFMASYQVARVDSAAFALDQVLPPDCRSCACEHPSPVAAAATAASDASGPALNRFVEGMRLEAVDVMPERPIVCVATIARVQGPCVLVHFDGWSSKYDYWTSLPSNKLFPPGFCRRNGLVLHPPKDMRSDRDAFDWDIYLTGQNAIAAPADLFPQGHATSAAVVAAASAPPATVLSLPTSLSLPLPADIPPAI